MKEQLKENEKLVIFCDDTIPMAEEGIDMSPKESQELDDKLCKLTKKFFNID